MPAGNLSHNPCRPNAVFSAASGCCAAEIGFANSRTKSLQRSSGSVTSMPSIVDAPRPATRRPSSSTSCRDDSPYAGSSSRRRTSASVALRLRRQERARSRPLRAAPGPCSASVPAVASANLLRRALRARRDARRAWAPVPARWRPRSVGWCPRSRACSGLNPVVAALVELAGEFLVAGLDDSAVGEHVDAVRHDELEQPLVVSHEQHRPFRRA